MSILILETDTDSKELILNRKFRPQLVLNRNSFYTFFLFCPFSSCVFCVVKTTSLDSEKKHVYNFTIIITRRKNNKYTYMMILGRNDCQIKMDAKCGLVSLHTVRTTAHIAYIHGRQNLTL